MATTSGDGVQKQRKKSFFIRRQAREMARNVILMCEEEKRNNAIAIPLSRALDRAVRYTGLSKSVLCKIKKEPTDERGRLKAPSRKGKKSTRLKDLNVYEFDRQVIHRCIEEFYLTEKIVPTCKKLLLSLREKMDFPWGVTSLRKLLKQMGYRWQKCQSKKRILIEKPSITYARSNYLRKIRQFRNDDRQIFFLHEAWIDSNLQFITGQRDDKPNATSTDTSPSNRLILVHAGPGSGFQDGSKLLFKAGKAGDCRERTNSFSFEKWANEVLLPNFPSKSVVVMNDVSAHSVQQNKIPPTSSTKQIMLEWLVKNNVQASVNIRKDELYDLILQNRTVEKSLDELIRGRSHDVLRLPPLMSDLNPIEPVWVKVKRLLWEHSVTSGLSSDTLKEVADNAIMQVTPEDWSVYDKHVVALEEHYWENDGLMESVVDSFTVEAFEKSDEDDCTSNSSSDDSDSCSE